MDYSKLQRGDVLNFKNNDLNITATVKNVLSDRILFYGVNGSFIFSFNYLNNCTVTLIEED